MDNHVNKIVKTEQTLEEALRHAKFGCFNVCLIITSGFILANVILETFGISFVLPVSQCELNWTMTERSVLSSVTVMGIIISSHLWGYLADTKGRKRVILPTLILGFVFEFLASFSVNFWMFALLKLFNGIFVSGSSATIYAYIGEFHTTKNRDRAIMIASTLYGFGTIFMSILAWLIINQEWSFYIPVIGLTYKPWRLYMVACALPGLICGLVLFGFPESPKYLLSVGRDEEALETIKYIYEKNTKNKRDSFPVSKLLKEPLDEGSIIIEGEGNFLSTLCKSVWDQTAPLFNKQFIWLTLLICFLQFVVFSTANGMYMWFPDILNSVMEYNKENPDNSTYICEIYKEKIGQVFSGSHHGTACVEKFEISTYIYSIYVEIGYILGFAVISGFIKIVSKKYIIAFVLFVTGACGIVAVLVKHSTTANILYIILLVCALAENLLGSASVELYPTKLRAMSVCISLMFGRLGCVFGTFYIGAMLKDYCDISFYACGGSLIIAGLLAFFIPNAKKEPAIDSPVA